MKTKRKTDRRKFECVKCKKVYRAKDMFECGEYGEFLACEECIKTMPEV